MLPAEIQLLDNFTRADEGPPPSTNWQGVTANNMFALVACRIVSNRLRWAVGQTSCSDYWLTSFGADQEVFMTTVSAASIASIYTRVQTPGSATTKCYEFKINVTPGFGRITRVLPAGNLALGSDFPIPVAADKAWCLRSVSDQHYAFVQRADGSWKLVAVRQNSEITGAGFLGLTFDSDNGYYNFGGGIVLGDVAESPDSALPHPPMRVA